MKKQTTASVILTVAAAGGIGAGAIIHSVSLPAKPTGSSTSTPLSTTTGTTSSAASTTTSTTSTSATSTPTRQSGPITKANLLVANDYLGSGASSARITAIGLGAGQGALSRCQDRDPGEFAGIVRMYTADAELGGQRRATQLAVSMSTDSDAINLLSMATEWQTVCAGPADNALHVQFGDVHQVALAGQAEGQWWDLTFTEDDGSTSVERVATGRSGNRATIIVLTVQNGAAASVDAGVLLGRAMQRLG